MKTWYTNDSRAGTVFSPDGRNLPFHRVRKIRLHHDSNKPIVKGHKNKIKKRKHDAAGLTVPIHYDNILNRQRIDRRCAQGLMQNLRL